MPTENERKYVLSCVDANADLTEVKGRNRFAHICQGYLVRDKKITCRVRYSVNSAGDHDYKMTVKREVRGRVVEVETQIDQRDFDDLWSVCKGKLHKVRVYIEDWEVDFFLDSDGDVYFVLAEHEMPEGQEVPQGMTAFVRDRLLYEVPRGDDRCSNRKLGKTNYASKLLSSLRKEANQNGNRHPLRHR
jgi:CYTH domain-containing protein